MKIFEKKSTATWNFNYVYKAYEQRVDITDKNLPLNVPEKNILMYQEI